MIDRRYIDHSQGSAPIPAQRNWITVQDARRSRWAWTFTAALVFGAAGFIAGAWLN